MPLRAGTEHWVQSLRVGCWTFELAICCLIDSLREMPLEEVKALSPREARPAAGRAALGLQRGWATTF